MLRCHLELPSSFPRRILVYHGILKNRSDVLAVRAGRKYVTSIGRTHTFGIDVAFALLSLLSHWCPSKIAQPLTCGGAADFVGHRHKSTLPTNPNSINMCWSCFVVMHVLGLRGQINQKFPPIWPHPYCIDFLSVSKLLKI